MAYFEGEIPVVTSGNNNNNGWNDFSWIIGLALVGGLFGGWGNGGFGFGGGRGGYVPNPATQADLSAGFANSEIMSDLNDIILGQAQMQNFINQGFAGLNNTINTGFAGVNNAVCTLGYNQAQLVNGLSRELADCCCTTQRNIDSLRFDMSRGFCDVVRAGQDNTRAILDFLTGEKISSLQAENAGLKAQISNDRQSSFIVNTLTDRLGEKCPQPAYVVQPPQQVTFPTNCCGNVAYANNGCSGFGIQ